MSGTVINGYVAAARELIAKYAAISPDKVFSPVAHLLPVGSGRTVDIGAGTGAGAAWFASRGQYVLAVEPVEEFRQAGMARHKSANVEWLDDALPDLPRTRERGEKFDLVMLSAVWHHLDSDQRQRAMPALAALIAPGGSLVISVRTGPGARARPVYNSSPEDLIDLANAAGLRLRFRKLADPVQPANQAAGVTFCWLVFYQD